MNTTPFIIISAHSEREQVETALQLGVNAYVIRPFTSDLLIRKIIPVSNNFERRKFKRAELEGNIFLRFGHYVNYGIVSDISMGRVLGLFPRKDRSPQVLEKTVVDLELIK